ncbi:1-deoxyxylulose-5-phosphate synthase YajO-like [Haliotis asinina]|uniref:1-deoxyxylulose-5-phosphate synthase YajO-like n=1 Tax=Haliotis asinina TaxID=109174 RepID=UPI0035321ADB
MAGDICVEYNFLGQSGLRVSNICLGTMTFGERGAQRPKQLNEEQAHKVLDRFVEKGGNFIDTADKYQHGQSEEYIGTWLKGQPRESVAIATKVRNDMNDGNQNRRGLSRRHITSELEKSLERLQTNYLDLYQTHEWDTATPIEETLRTLDDLVRCGKVRYFGASNLAGYQLQKIVDTTKHLNLNPLISIQQQYNLLARTSEYEVFEVCKHERLAVLPWSPLKGGLLTGKYERGVSPPATQGRAGWVNQDLSRAIESHPSLTQYDNESYWQLVDYMKATAAKYGKSVGQVALRWLLQKPAVPSVVIGVTSLAQLDDNMGAGTGWKLSVEEMAKLDELTHPGWIYPYGRLISMNRDRVNPFMA